MQAQDAIKWMTLFNDKIQVNKDYLSQLDTPIGDGDHGGNMARGMSAVMENLDGKEFASAADVFKGRCYAVARQSWWSFRPIVWFCLYGAFKS